jgi:acetyl esterase/lipase
LKLTGDDLQRIKGYCLAGKPIVGVRTASHAIQTWLEFDKEVLGGNYQSHYRNGPATDVTITSAGKDHPLLAGVSPFRSAGSLYKNTGLAADNVILMTGSDGEHSEPITWTRDYKGARIFYTALGHQQDFGEESFRRLLANALFWTARHNPPRPDAKSASTEIELQKDVVYGTGAGEELRLDLAMAAGLDKPAPAIVWIHGGGWRGGDKSEFESQLRASAANGYVAVSINYRLVPKHVFPAQVEDSKCAVRWLRANAERLHVDPERIGAVGSSAGAHLSMMLGAMGPDDALEGSGGNPGVSSRVHAVVSYAGPTNLGSPFPTPSKPLVAAFLGGPAEEKQDTARAASPLTYVNAGDPPMLLIQGTKDILVPHDQALQMVEALSIAGVGGRLELLFGEGHGWPKQQARVERATFEFLKLHLQP